MSNTKDVMIGDNDYTFKKLGAIAQLGLLCKLRKLVGSDIAATLSGAGDKDIQQIGIELIMALTENMDEDKLMDVISTIMKSVVVTPEGGKSKRVDVNTDFEDVKEMFQVALEALKHNFGDFLEGVLTPSS